MLKGIPLPSSDLVAADALAILSATPVSVSPNGQLAVVDVLYTNGSYQLHAFVQLDLTDGSYLTNYNTVVGLGDETAIEAYTADVSWSPDSIPTVRLSYEDLTDASSSGLYNRIASVTNTTLVSTDLIEATSNVVADGSVHKLVAEQTGRYIAFETGATNLAPTGSLDTNTINDVYLLDTQSNTLTRISALPDGTESNEECHLRDIAIIDGKVSVLFSTTAAQTFSADDTNTEEDLYLWRDGAISLVSSNDSGFAAGYDGGLSTFVGDDITFVATDLIDSDTDGLADLYIVDTVTLNKQIDSVVDDLVFGADYNLWLEGANNSSVILGTEAVSQSGVDLSGQLLTINLSENNSDVLSVSSSGTLGNDYSYTPATNDSGNTTVFNSAATNLVTLDSGTGILVSHINSAPTGSIDLLGTVYVGETVTVSLDNLSDPDGFGSGFSYSWVLDGFEYSSTSTKSFTFNQDMKDAEFSVVVSYTDNWGAAESIELATPITVTVPNRSPTLDAVQSIVAAEDATIAITSNATDPDDDQLAYSVTTVPSHGAVTETSEGVFSYTPSNNYVGSDSFVVTVTDGNGGSDTQTINLTLTAVEDEATGTLSVTGDVKEGGAVSASFANLTDVDGAISSTSYQWQISADGSSGWTVLTDETESTYTIASDQSQVGTYLRVAATTTDALGGETTFASASALIANINDAPEVSATQSISTAEDTAVSITVSGTDVDGDTLAYSVTTDSTHGSISKTSEGVFSYTPSSNYVGSDSFVVTVTDGNGGADTQTINLTVSAVEDEATGTLSVTGDVKEGGAVSASFANLTDVDGVISSTSYQWQISADGSSGWTDLTDETESTYTIASDQSHVGTYLRVAATTTDALGGETTFASASALIANINDAPEVSATQSISTAEDTAVSITVSGTDVDGDTLAYSVTTDSTHGSISKTSEGVFSYTPSSNYVGSDSFVVTVTDGNGGSDTQTINLTLTAVEDEATGTLSVTGDVKEGGAVSASFANLTDVDGAISSTSYQWQISADGSSGWTDLTDETESTYTIASDQSQVGTYLRVAATTTDALGGETTFASASALIANINDAPEVSATQSISTAEDTAVSITVSGTDVDGDTLAYSVTTDSTHGSISKTSEGVFSYTPSSNYVGSDSFVVTVTDGNGGADTQTINLTVSAVEDEATGTLSVTGDVKEGGAVSASFANLTDVDGAISSTSYQWQISADGSSGWTDLTDETESTYTIDPDQSQAGNYLRVVGITTDDLGGTTNFQSDSYRILNQGKLIQLGDKTLNHGTIIAELDGTATTVSSDSPYFDLQGSTIGTVTLDPAMHTSDIGIGDVIASLRHVEGLSPLTGKAALAADVDNDSDIGIGDVIAQLRHIVGLSPISRFDAVNNDGTEVADTLQNQNSIELILNGDVDLSTELTPAFFDM